MLSAKCYANQTVLVENMAKKRGGRALWFSWEN